MKSNNISQFKSNEVFSSTIVIKLSPIYFNKFFRSLQEIIDQINEHKEVLRSIFSNHTNSQQDPSILNINHSESLLASFFKILNLNILSTNDYFNEDNEKISKIFDLR